MSTVEMLSCSLVCVHVYWVALQGGRGSLASKGEQFGTWEDKTCSDDAAGRMCSSVRQFSLVTTSGGINPVWGCFWKLEGWCVMHIQQSGDTFVSTSPWGNERQQCQWRQACYSCCVGTCVSNKYSCSREITVEVAAQLFGYYLSIFFNYLTIFFL